MQDPSLLSARLLRAVKNGQDHTPLLHELTACKLAELANLSPDQKLAFWINSYNAWFQILAAKSTSRTVIFTDHPIHFEDVGLSLDEIEHGILRGLKPHPSSPEASAYRPAIQELSVKTPDPRIHFVLNCGVGGCPLLAFYSSANIDAELEAATVAFLESECRIDEHKKLVETSSLFKWYSEDFGGPAGVLKWLAEKLRKPELSGYSLEFRPYDQSEKLLAFRAR